MLHGEATLLATAATSISSVCTPTSTATDKLTCREKLDVEVCSDFLQVSSSAMVQLKAGNRSNVVYNLAKGIGTCRENETESRFPVGKMPMGLVEYTANFFVANNINSVYTLSSYVLLVLIKCLFT